MKAKTKKIVQFAKKGNFVDGMGDGPVNRSKERRKLLSSLFHIIFQNFYLLRV